MGELEDRIWNKIDKIWKNIDKIEIKLSKIENIFDIRFRNLEEQLKAFGIEMDRIEKKSDDRYMRLNERIQWLEDRS